MIIGNPSIFAIESGIQEAYENLGFLALGFFVIHIRGRCYGMRLPDSSLLACSFYQVEDRIANRGKHTAPFATDLDAEKIASAFRSAIYFDDREEYYFGIPTIEFCHYFSCQSNDCMWVPDGDEAFDDGSYILQFDVNDRVRLIAFKSCENARYDPSTLNDLWLDANDFYNILEQWHNTFMIEWVGMPKISESEE